MERCSRHIKNECLTALGLNETNLFFSVLILLESLLKLDKMEYTHFHLEDVRVCCDVFEVFIQKKREIQRCFQNCTLHAWLQALIPRESKGIPDVNRWLKQNRASRWIIKAEIDSYRCTFLRQKLSSLTLRKVICLYCMGVIEKKVDPVQFALFYNAFRWHVIVNDLNYCQCLMFQRQFAHFPCTVFSLINSL